MSIESILEKFDLFIATPGAVERLREVVLALATQGHLVSQDGNDESVDSCLLKIAHACKRAINDRLPVCPDEIPHEIPASWTWVRLVDLALSSDSGWSPQCLSEPRSGMNWGVLKVSAVSWGRYQPEENKALPFGLDGRADCVVKPGDFLLSRANTADLVARSVIVDEAPDRLMMSDKIVRFRFPADVVKEYVNLVNLSAPSRAYYARNASGTSSSMKNVGREVMNRLPIPFPPLAEQRRIVAKVDELMAVCDRLDAQQRERDTRHAALAHAAIARFTAAPTPDNLQYLFHPTYDIAPADLRKAILAQAIQGNLSPNVAKRRMDDAVSDPTISGAFELPGDWRWRKLGDVAQIERGGSPRPIKDYITDDPDGLNWIKIGDTERGGKYITGTSEKIRKEGLVKTRMVFPGDFLLTNSMSFGRPYISKIQGCIHDGWLRIHPPANIDQDFLYHLLSSPYVFDFFRNAAAGAVVQNLNADKVRELPIPIPPLSEQRRIVAAVDRLMSLVERYESQLATARDTATRLLDALVAELTGSVCPGTLALSPASGARRTSAPDGTESIEPTSITRDVPARAPATPDAGVNIGAPGEVAARLLVLLRDRGSLSSSEAQAAAGLDPATLRGLFKTLIDQGLVRTEGQRRGMRYLPTGKAAHAE